MSKTIQYSNEEIRDLLSSGYMLVSESLWDYIPKGAQIRYLKNTPGEPESARFRPGGYVKCHFVSSGKKMILLESQFGGKPGQQGYWTWPIVYSGLEKIWKRYSADSFIETYSTVVSLSTKQKQITELQSEITKLTARISALETGAPPRTPPRARR